MLDLVLVCLRPKCPDWGTLDTSVNTGARSSSEAPSLLSPTMCSSLLSVGLLSQSSSTRGLSDGMMRVSSTGQMCLLLCLYTLSCTSTSYDLSPNWLVQIPSDQEREGSFGRRRTRTVALHYHGLVVSMLVISPLRCSDPCQLTRKYPLYHNRLQQRWMRG